MERDITLLFLIFLQLLNTGHATTILGNGSPGEACQMGGGVMGVCEEVGSCVKSGGVVRRSDQVTLCSARPPQVVVCCRKPQVIAKQLCDAWSEYWRGEEGHCVQDNPLIFGGEDATLGEFPHIAVLGRKEAGKPINWDCGGTLISPHFVLTAAHCVPIDSVEYWVRLGDHDLRTNKTGELLPHLSGPMPSSLPQEKAPTSPTAPLEQLRRGRAIRHPEYHFFKYHDIALLKLDTPVSLTSRVLPACLPTDPNDDLMGKVLTVAGWGQTSFSSQAVRQLHLVLQKVRVPVIDLLECSRRASDPTGRATPRGILPRHLCAGGDGKDSCQGDSGGPLVDKVPKDGAICEHTVVGVVSFGYGCGDLGVYARVSSYLDWIMGYVAPNLMI